MSELDRSKRKNLFHPFTAHSAKYHHDSPNSTPVYHLLVDVQGFKDPISLGLPGK